MSDGGRPLPQSKASKDGKATKAVSQHKRTRYSFLDTRFSTTHPPWIGVGVRIEHRGSSIEHPDWKGVRNG